GTEVMFISKRTVSEGMQTGLNQVLRRMHQGGGYTADLALVVDTSELHIQGQGGVITGWIEIESPQTFHDGIRSKMIHAGGKVYGANAIEKMMKVIATLQELERHWAVTKSYPGFPAGMNTINPAVIEGGRHAAFVADRCALWITVHFYPDENYEQVVQEIEECVLAAAKADPWLRNNLPKFRWGGKSMIEDRGEIFPSLALRPEQPGVEVLAEMHRSIIGTEPVIDMSGTVTDAGWLGRAGIETVIYGPGDLKNAHAVDESLALSELLDFTKVIARMIGYWCNTRK
ncbi:acetylornithine deacetylase, partial [Alicyclobacillus tolerans]|uniref:acetylornithine deacetylase n=1 Tax=Alicyclobacillus tolerans TaxID=90970 RepID=UPI001F19632B